MVRRMKLPEAAARKTRNDDILYLCSEDIMAAIATRMKAKDFPHFDEFNADHFEPYRKKAEYFTPVFEKKSWDQRSRSDYEKTKSALKQFMNTLQPGDENYDDMLDMFTEHYLNMGEMDFDKRPSEGRLQLYLDNRDQQNETWLEVGCGFTGLDLVQELSRHPEKHNIRLILNDLEKAESLHAIERYADRLKIDNVVTIHADAGSEEFKQELKKLLGDQKISQIRANKVLNYVEDKDLFFRTCKELLKNRGMLHINETNILEEEEITPQMRERIEAKGRVIISGGPKGKPVVANYSPRKFAEEYGFEYKDRFERHGGSLHHYATLKKI